MGSIELDQLRAELEDLHGITSGVLSRIDALRETALTMEPVAFGEAIVRRAVQVAGPAKRLGAVLLGGLRCVCSR
jgi:hypothetical protein